MIVLKTTLMLCAILTGQSHLEPMEPKSEFHCETDKVSTSNAILHFFRDLRNNGQLLLKEEFDQLGRDNYLSKGGQIDRIQGAQFIDEKIKLNGIQHVKVPHKIAVVDSSYGDIVPVFLGAQQQLQSWYLDGAVDDDGFANWDVWKNSIYFQGKNHMTVYSKKITYREAATSPEEREELGKVIRATGYRDPHPGQFITAKDGVYIIDTDEQSIGKIKPISDSCLEPGSYNFTISQLFQAFQINNQT